MGRGRARVGSVDGAMSPVASSSASSPVLPSPQSPQPGSVAAAVTLDEVIPEFDRPSARPPPRERQR